MSCVVGRARVMCFTDVHSTGDKAISPWVCAPRHWQPISINLINYKFHLKLESPNRPSTAADLLCVSVYAMLRHRLPFYADHINFNNLENWLCDGEAQHLRCGSFLFFSFAPSTSFVRAFMARTKEHLMHHRALHSQFTCKQNCKCRAVKKN